MRLSVAVEQAAGPEAACAVCQQDYSGDEELVQLPCKHWFHRDCVLQWLRASKQCPICMREVET